MSPDNSNDSILDMVRDGLRLAHEAYTQTLPQEWEEAIENRARQVDDPCLGLLRGNLNVVLFHIEVPADAGEIIAPDIKNLDHNQIDYEALVRLNIQIALRTNPRARIFLFTDYTFLADMAEHERLHISRLDVDPREPMFERVITMAAYIRSTLFQQPTVFLDSDAFLIRPVHNLFINHFDVALTHRNVPGQMPINEGVIFVNDINRIAVKRVFDSYLASYLSIESNRAISQIYKNLRRWRGGQLSVNSVAQGGQVYATGQLIRSGARIVYLPCSVYNLSEIKEQEVAPNLLSRVAVLHLKGPRKSWADSLKIILDT